ncbi:MAG: Fe2+-dependent dioxygenase [Alphaproteobacteria bacterium]
MIDILTPDKVAQLREIGRKATYVDGKISNPHSTVKNNLQLHDQAAYAQSSQIIAEALMTNPEFREFAFPEKIAPPMMTRYEPGMNYGLHADSAMIPLPRERIRSDLSCTVFLSDPSSYEGGSLHVNLGSGSLRFKGAAGAAIVYPSHTLHEVEPVTKGERHVAITFIESQIPDVTKRNVLYELNEVAALEGLNMSSDNFTRLQAVQSNLSRLWML